MNVINGADSIGQSILTVCLRRLAIVSRDYLLCCTTSQSIAFSNFSHWQKKRKLSRDKYYTRICS